MLNVLKDVCILGEYSRNIRIYPDNVLDNGKALFENAPIFIQHVKANINNILNRSKKNQIGHVKNIYHIKKKGLFADAIFYDEKVAKTVYYSLLNKPYKAAFSPVIQATNHTIRGINIVDSIERVFSVDLIPNEDYVKSAATTADIYNPYTSEEIGEFIKNIVINFDD